MKYLFVGALVLLASLTVSAQDLNPVTWSHELRPLKGSTDIYELVVTASIQKGWYIYSQNLESDEGPVPTSFGFESVEGVEYLGYVEERGKKIEGFDKVFSMNLIKYADKVEYVQLVRIQPGVTELNCFVEYMTCNNEVCLPPREMDFVVRI